MHTLLLIAHGSRRPEANADLHTVADDMRRRNLAAFVQCSYLELCEPSIHAGGVKCVEAGATSVVMLPYFLSPGRHVAVDLTEARDQLAADYPHVRFTLAQPLAGHPLLLDALAERATSAIISLTT